MSTDRVILAWLWLAILLIVFANFGFYKPLDLTLKLVILYLLLTNVERLPALIDKLTAGLTLSGGASSDGDDATTPTERRAADRPGYGGSRP